MTASSIKTMRNGLAHSNGIAAAAATTTTTTTPSTSTKVPVSSLVPPHPHYVHNNHVPYLCQYWCYISNEIIPKYVPFHLHIYHLDVTLTIASALILSLIRYISEYSMIYLFQWPPNTYITKNAAASVAAIFHSIQLVPSLYVCFRSLSSLSASESSDGQRNTGRHTTGSSNQYNPSQHMMVVSDTWWKDTVDALFQFCTGYMIYDGVLNILYMKYNMIGQISSEDYLFLGHHLATILYMSSVRYIQQGHQSAMICMLLGELTNPFHNMYYIAQAAQTLSCCNGTIATWLFHSITLAFAVSYVLVRTIVGPFVFVHLTYNLWTTGRRKDIYPIPISLLILWTILIWAVILGSIPWIVECYHMIQSYHTDPTPLLVLFSSQITTTVPSDIHTEL